MSSNTLKRQVIGTCIVYWLHSFFIGLQFSSRMIHVVFYLEQIKADDVAFWQGMATVSSQGVSMLYTVPAGYLCDKYNNARWIISLMNVICITGLLVYSWFHTIFTFLLGLILQGSFHAVEALFIGELGKIFEVEVMTRVISLISNGIGVGLIFGPCLSYVTSNVNFKIGSFLINSINAPILICAFIQVLIQILLMLFQYNHEEINSRVSLHGYNIVEVEIEKRSTLECKESIDGNEFIGPWDAFTVLIKNVDLMVIYSGTLIWVVILHSFEAIVPLVSVELLKIPSDELSIIYFGSGIVITTCYFICMIPNLDTYYGALVTASIQLLVPGLLILIYYLSNLESRITRYVYFAWVILGMCCWMLENVFAKSLSSQTVPLKLQSYGEGVRGIFGSIGRISSGFIVWQWYSYTLIVSIILFALGCFQIVALLIRFKTLHRPLRIGME